MRFDVLGPLLVTDTFARIELTTRRRRALLSWLVLNANESVGIEATVGVLWPGHTPISAPAQVRRLALELACSLGRDVLDVGRGLTLSTAPESIDACRFETLIDQAGYQLGHALREPALASLKAAIALWRAKPYPELDRAVAAIGVIDRLTDRYLDSVEAAHALALAGPVDYRLVADLRAAVTLHPARARLRCQLALALYRTGRQVEALATLRELIAAPGARERAARLQSAILRQDPDLLRGELAEAGPGCPSAGEWRMPPR